MSAQLAAAEIAANAAGSEATSRWTIRNGGAGSKVVRCVSHPPPNRSLSGGPPGRATRANPDRLSVMAEVSPPTALDPATRTASRSTPDTLTRITPSPVFRSLLRGSLGGPNSARRPVAHPGRPGVVQTDREPPATRHPSHPRRDEDAASEPRPNAGKDGVLDPLWCQMACQMLVHPGITPAVVPAAPSLASATLPLREDLQNLLSGLARRVAWGGDRRKGTARIELSEGALAGATLVVHAEQRSVSVEIELPDGSNAGQGLQQRILDRLEGRGFAARVRIE